MQRPDQFVQGRDHGVSVSKLKQQAAKTEHDVRFAACSQQKSRSADHGGATLIHACLSTQNPKADVSSQDLLRFSSRRRVCMPEKSLTIAIYD